MTSLAERLSAIVPLGEPGMCFFCQSGTESVEGALKLARYVTKRQRIIAFLGSFHGRTMGSLSLTSSKYTQQAGFFPSMPGVTHVPYPNTYRPLFAGNDQGKAVLDYIGMLFERNVPPSEVAAIVIEPLQGEGGYLVPPEGFLEGLRKLCDEHGILLVFDEVQSGIGRTGRLFASQHTGVTPDIMTLAKGLGSGMPIGAVVAKASLMKQWKKGAHHSSSTSAAIPSAAQRRTRRNKPRARAVRAERGQGRRALHEAARGAAALSFPASATSAVAGSMIGVEMIEKDGSPARAMVDRLAASRVSRWAPAAVLRRVDAALHAAALRDGGRGRRGDDLPEAEPRRGIGGRRVIRAARRPPRARPASDCGARRGGARGGAQPGQASTQLLLAGALHPAADDRAIVRGVHAVGRRADLQHGRFALAARTRLRSRRSS